MGKNTYPRKIIIALSAFLIVASHVVSATETDEASGNNSLSTAQIRTEVDRVLENFQRNMDEYYERTRAKKKASTRTTMAKRAREVSKSLKDSLALSLVGTPTVPSPLSKVDLPSLTYEVPVYQRNQHVGMLNEYDGKFSSRVTEILNQEEQSEKVNINGTSSFHPYLIDRKGNRLHLQRVDKEKGAYYVLTDHYQNLLQQQPKSYLQLIPTDDLNVPGYREEFYQRRHQLYEQEQKQKEVEHKVEFNTPYHRDPYQPYKLDDVYHRPDNVPQNSRILQDVMDWVNGKWSDSKVIKLSELPDDSYIAWFGTAHKGFDKDNNDNNGYAWLSNYHESGKSNPNSKYKKKLFRPNYGIKVIVDGEVYKIGNVETPYHMFKFYTQVLKPGEKRKAINYSDYSKKNPNAARSDASVITKFAFGKADQLVFHLLEQKFFNNNRMAKALLDTGVKLLFEGNRWFDGEFGMKLSGDNKIKSGPPPEGSTLEGKSKLGKMLMKIRKKISDEMGKDSKFAAFVNDPTERNYEWIKPRDFNSF